MKAQEISLRCVVCGKLLRVLEPSMDSPPEMACWDGAVVESIMGGYGSQHDLARLIIGICDDCIDKKLADSSIIQDVAQEAEDWRLRSEETNRILNKGVL